MEPIAAYFSKRTESESEYRFGESQFFYWYKDLFLGHFVAMLRYKCTPLIFIRIYFDDITA